MRASSIKVILVCLALGACEDTCQPTDVSYAAVNVRGVVRIDGVAAPGITVVLRPDGQPASMDVTDGNGNYSLAFQFDNTVNQIGPNYRVSVVAPAGIVFVQNPIANPSGGGTIDFEGYTIGSISGTVWWNDVGVEGVSLQVSAPHIVGGVLASYPLVVITDATGSFSLTDLPSGTASILALPFQNESVVTPATATVTVNGGPAVQDFEIRFDAGPLVGRVTASGSGLAGVRVTAAGPWPATTVTDASGGYSFSTVRSGDYEVSIDGFDATVFAFPTTSQTVMLMAGQSGRADFDATIIGQNALPVPTITSPAAGSRFGTGTVIQFAGSATDVEDGILTGPALTWSSTLDGAIGSGGTVMTALSEGLHTVKLKATDSDGGSSTASVSVEVVANQPPTVAIVTPVASQILTQGSTFTFQGSGSDPEDGALSGASLVWTSDVEGQIGTGASLSRALNTTGFHDITLTGTDSLGATASVMVRIYVQPN